VARARRAPVLPLRSTPPLPGTTFTVSVQRPLAVAAIEAATPADPHVVLLTQREVHGDPSSREAFRPLGVLAVVLRAGRDARGLLEVALEARERVRVEALTKQGSHLEAHVAPAGTGAAPDDLETSARVSTLRSLLGRWLAAHADGEPEAVPVVSSPEDVGLFVDQVMGRLDVPARDRRTVLEELDVRARLDLAVRLAGRAVDVAQLARRIEGEVSGRVEAEQRVALLRAQLETIRRELGLTRDPRIEALRKRLVDARLPDEVGAEARAELDRLEDAGPLAGDRAGSLLRLESLLRLPWGTPRSGPVDLVHVRAVLDRDHRGQAAAKERLLDALAPGVLRADGCIPPICLVGPSGVGKSSLADGLAEALARPVVHVRLSGVDEASDLWGERRLTPEARPGRVLEALLEAQVPDPVLVLDGLDVLALEYPGDLVELLEGLLDAPRRSRFEDRWLGVPFDLSGAMIVVTLQVVEVLPPDVRDRLVEVPLRGYLDGEKLEIARDHLLPALRKEAGLDEDVSLPETTLQAIIDGWTFESGVHELQRALRMILRRVAARRAAGWKAPHDVGPADLPDILGPRQRHMERVERSCAPGLAMGLAWTPEGGQVLFIEAAAVPGTGEVKLTGSLGDVMKESAAAALTWLREHAPEVGNPRERDLHVHVPAGGVPKDGPSAGIALLVAIASALGKRVVRHDLAMSGEITLRGQVLPVGGIREKVMAAPRAGIRALILPKANEQDLAEIPRESLDGLSILLVERVEEALAAAFGDAPCGPKERRLKRRLPRARPARTPRARAQAEPARRRKRPR
jgi:ATP-dependent Lon protease